jgi:hypothetical protein
MGEARFGIRDGARYSAPWIVSVKSRRPEFSLMLSAVYGSNFHLTVHDAEYGSHITVHDGSGDSPKLFPHPAPFRPGLRRFVCVLMPDTTAWRPAPRRADRIVWVPATGESTRWRAFHLVVAEPTVDPEWWRGTAALLAQAPLSSGSVLMLLQSTEPGFDGEWTATSRSPRLEEVRAAAKRGEAGAIIVGTSDDGSIWLLDLPRSATAPDRGSDGKPPRPSGG